MLLTLLLMMMMLQDVKSLRESLKAQLKGLSEESFMLTCMLLLLLLTLVLVLLMMVMQDVKSLRESLEVQLMELSEEQFLRLRDEEWAEKPTYTPGGPLATRSTQVCVCVCVCVCVSILNCSCRLMPVEVEHRQRSLSKPLEVRWPCAQHRCVCGWVGGWV